MIKRVAWLAAVGVLAAGCGSGGGSDAPQRAGSPGAPGASAPVPAGQSPSGSGGPANTPGPAGTPAGEPKAPPAPAVKPGNIVKAQWTTNSGGKRWEEIVFHGGNSGVTMKVWVWLPPQYHQPEFRNHAFPVIYAYPGFPGVKYNSYQGGSLQAAKHLEIAIQNGSHPFIMVAPQMALADDLETECSDIPGQPKVGTWMVEDLPNMVRERYRVIRDRAGTGITGASSGGFCATKIGFQRPHEYKAIVSTSGYFKPVSELWGRPPATEADKLANSPYELARTKPADVDLLLTSGTSESGTPEARSLMEVVRPPTRAEVAWNEGAKHETIKMQEMMPRIFAFFTKNLAGPRPMLPHEKPAKPGGGR